MIYAVHYDAENLSKQEDKEKQKLLTGALLEHVIEKETGEKPDFSMLKHSEHGKPYFKESSFHYNNTNCRGLVISAISEKEIGIDAENIRTYKEKLVDKVCTPQEKRDILLSKDKNIAFTKLWTLKEAYLKYTGDGLSKGPKSIEFADVDSNPVPINISEFDCVFIATSKLNVNGIDYIISVVSEDSVNTEVIFIPESELLK